MKLILLITICLLLLGCTILPNAADPLPLSVLAEPDRKNKNVDMCRLLNEYGLASNNCKPVTPEAKDTQLMMARNELTHRLMAESTELCNDFKGRYAGRTWKGSKYPEMLALLLAVPATAVTSQNLAQWLTAGGAASNGISGIFDNQSPDDIDSVMQGIELERTRIAKQIIKRNSDSILTYPASRAINDVLELC